jgi:hypothetical protein
MNPLAFGCAFFGLLIVLISHLDYRGLTQRGKPPDLICPPPIVRPFLGLVKSGYGDGMKCPLGSISAYSGGIVLVIAGIVLQAVFVDVDFPVWSLMGIVVFVIVWGFVFNRVAKWLWRCT